MSEMSLPLVSVPQVSVPPERHLKLWLNPYSSLTFEGFLPAQPHQPDLAHRFSFSPQDSWWGPDRPTAPALPFSGAASALPTVPAQPPGTATQP